MKRTMLLMFLWLAASAGAKSNNALIKNYEISELTLDSPLVIIPDISIITINDTANVVKYDLSNTFDADTTQFSYLVCDVIERTDKDNILVQSLTINKSSLFSSTYIAAGTQYFIEGGKVYFSIKQLDYLDRRSLKISAYDANNTLVFSISQNILN